MNRFVAALALAAVAVVQLSAAVPARADGGELVVERVDVDDHPRVEILVGAPGMLPSESAAARFELLENGSPAPVEVERVGDDRHQLLLVIDTSGSMAANDAIIVARESAIAFVDAMPADMPIGLVTFATDSELRVEPTADHATVREEIGLIEAGGGTALYDAVIGAVDAFDDTLDGSRYLIVLADGEDNESVADVAEAQRRLAEAGVVVHGIELRTSVSDLDTLRELSSPTGGQTHTVTDASDLEDAYRSVAITIPRQFVLRYETQQHGTTGIEILAEVDEAVWVGGTTLQLPERDVVSLPSPPADAQLPGTTTPRISPLLMTFGLALLYASVAIAYLVVFPPMARVDLNRRGAEGRTKLGLFADRAAYLAEWGLRRGPWTERFEQMLDRSDVRLSPGRFLVRFATVCVAVTFVGSILAGPLLAILLLAAVAILTKLWLGFKADRRRARFADQLDDTLQLLAGSLRAGHSLLQAVNTVAQEAAEPTASEFRRIVSSTRVGQDLAYALETTVERTGSADFAWIAQAIAIHREVGGNLASVLDEVAGTIRDRNQIRRQVEALSAEGRLSALVLMALPIGVVAFLSVVNPAYLARFFESVAGLAMLGVAALLMIAGVLWLRKIVRVEF